MFTDEVMDKEDAVCAYTGILLSHVKKKKKEWKLAIFDNMGTP